jgi:ADP-heptose:LPS heptosyltransferase
VFVGHDSGLTHLAAALGRPTVAIFGPTDPEIWGPRGKHVTVVPMVPEHEGAGTRDPSWTTVQTAHSDLRQVMEAVRHWLAPATPTQSPDDRSVRW